MIIKNLKNSIVFFALITGLLACKKRYEFDKLLDCKVEWKTESFIIQSSSNSDKFDSLSFTIKPLFFQKIYKDDFFAECLPTHYYPDEYDTILFISTYDYNSQYKANDTINNIIGKIRYSPIKEKGWHVYYVHYYSNLNDFFNDTIKEIGTISFELLEPPDTNRLFNFTCHVKLKDGRKFTFKLNKDVNIKP